MMTKEEALASVADLYYGYGKDLILSKQNLQEYIEQQEDKETLRDKFAMAALTGNLAYSHVNPSLGNFQENFSAETLAEHCYMMADAMMEARNKWLY